jgi:hypothetical protein
MSKTRKIILSIICVGLIISGIGDIVSASDDTPTTQQ